MKTYPATASIALKYTPDCLRLITALLTGLVLLACQAQSQTLPSIPGTGSTNNMAAAASPGSFIGTVGNWFTSANTNLPVRGRGEVSLGMAYQSGVNIASDFSVRFKFPLSVRSGVFAETVTRNAGINGIIVSEQIGMGGYLIPASSPDIELSAGLLGGIRMDQHTAAFTLYGDARKMLTPNTFAGLRLAYEQDGAAIPSAPVLTVCTGFTF